MLMQVINVQYSPLTITSGGTIKVQGNSFTNVMCSAATTNTRLYSWQLPFTPVQVGLLSCVDALQDPCSCHRDGVMRAPHQRLNHLLWLYHAQLTGCLGMCARPASDIPKPPSPTFCK